MINFSLYNPELNEEIVREASLYLTKICDNMIDDEERKLKIVLEEV